MTPLNGIVHSFAFNEAYGDYGTTIILTHQLNEISFYTLYGHLSLSSIKNLQGGEYIHKGEIFAEFGWPIAKLGDKLAFHRNWFWRQLTLTRKALTT